MENGQSPFTGRGVFFDMGGTLVFPDPKRIAGVFTRMVGISSQADDWMNAVHQATADLDRELAQNASYLTGEWWEIYFGRMRSSLPFGKDVREFTWKAFTKQLLKEHVTENLWSCWVPGVREVLDALEKAGFYLGVISNSDGRVQEQINRFGIQDKFRFVLDSHVVKCEKPAPEIFRLALEKSGLPAEDVLYVGDFVNIDYRGALGVGMKAVIIDPLGLRPDLGAPTIPDLPSLKGFIGLDA